MAFIKTIISSFLSFIAMLCLLFNIPFFPVGDKLDENRFTLTFSDEFDAPELDTSVWSGHYQYGDASTERKGCYWNKNLVELRDGNLIIPVVFLEEGMGGKGAGWYSAGIDTDDDAPNGFSQRYGYFECRCIIPDGADIWSAFWLYCPGVCNINGDGTDGTEIDIFESKPNNVVSINLHYDGYEEAHKHKSCGDFIVQNDPHKNFNTYGLEWNENEYIFYINGVEATRSSAGGISKVPEFPILSVEMKGENAIPSDRANVMGERTEFIVDYVRIYQYSDLV